MKIKWSIEKAKIEFKSKGLELLEFEFKNVDIPMKCIAKCGHEKKLSLYNLMAEKGLKCKKCTYETTALKRKFDYSYVNNYFEKEGCKLITTNYDKQLDKLIYIARCGHKNTITFNKFKNSKQGRVCKICCKPSGNNHHKYNSNLSNEERILNRDYYEIILWRLKVYERDNYECKVCGDNTGGNLNAHHLNGYNWDISNRLNINNGATLCEKCHSNFHKLYGFGNNTIEQFNEWYKGTPR